MPKEVKRQQAPNGCTRFVNPAATENVKAVDMKTKEKKVTDLI